MIKIKNHEIITDDEWYRRLIEDKEYIVISFDWDGGVTRVLDKSNGIMYDVRCVDVGNRKMLKVEEIY